MRRCVRRWLDRLMLRFGYVRKSEPPPVVGTVTDLSEARRLTRELRRNLSVVDAEIQALREERGRP